MNWFRNRRAEVAEQKTDFIIAHYERQIERLEKAHAETVLRVIEERDRLRDDIQRLQFVIQPSLQDVVTVQDREKQEERDQNAPPMEPIIVGSPWQRIKNEWAKKLQAEETEREKKLEARARMQAEAEALRAKGENNGGIS